jgi:nitrogenase molybdenum-iron protein alpha/beta subunit
VNAADLEGLPFLRELEYLLDKGADAPPPAIHVSGFQEFELYNILNNLRPSLFVGRGQQVLSAAHMGIPSLSLDADTFWGQTGALRFAESAARAVRFHGFTDLLNSCARFS